MIQHKGLLKREDIKNMDLFSDDRSLCHFLSSMFALTLQK